MEKVQKINFGSSVPMDPDKRKALLGRVKMLAIFTIAYNLVEALVSILFGAMANSIALIGFGLDSIVESLSGMVLVWRLSKHKKISKEEEEKIEKKAMKFVAITFFILGAYVLFESIRKLLYHELPEPSPPPFG